MEKRNVSRSEFFPEVDPKKSFSKLFFESHFFSKGIPESQDDPIFSSFPFQSSENQGQHQKSEKFSFSDLDEAARILEDQPVIHRERLAPQRIEPSPQTFADRFESGENLNDRFREFSIKGTSEFDFDYPSLDEDYQRKNHFAVRNPSGPHSKKVFSHLQPLYPNLMAENNQCPLNARTSLSTSEKDGFEFFEGQALGNACTQPDLEHFDYFNQSQSNETALPWNQSSEIPPQKNVKVTKNAENKLTNKSKKPKAKKPKRKTCKVSNDELVIDLDRIFEIGNTSLNIKNIPNKYSKRMLLELFDEDFKDTYNFFYLPMDLDQKCNLGFAFINMNDPSHVKEFYLKFHGKKWPKFNSEKICEVRYARLGNIEDIMNHLKSSSLMRLSDPAFKPFINKTIKERHFKKR